RPPVPPSPLPRGRFAPDQPLVLAGALISILPIVLLYLAGQRFFVRGLTAGIVKSLLLERGEHALALPHTCLGDRVEYEDRLIGARLGEVVQRACDRTWSTR